VRPLEVGGDSDDENPEIFQKVLGQHPVTGAEVWNKSYVG
jgi:hypothetical protein